MRAPRALIAVVLAALPAIAAAQGPGTPSAGAPSAWRLSLGGGVVWTGGYRAGGSRALETSNPTVSPNPLPLFTADARGDAAPGLSLLAGWHIGHGVSIEAEGQFSRPALSATLARDFENATSVTARTTFTQVQGGASLVYRFNARGRVAPFVAGGAAYVRRVSEGRATTEASSEFHAGGGIEIVIAEHMAVRADGRVSSQARAIGFTSQRRYVPQVLGTIIYGR